MTTDEIQTEVNECRARVQALRTSGASEADIREAETALETARDGLLFRLLSEEIGDVLKETLQ